MVPRSRKFTIGFAVLLGGAVLMALEVAGFRIIGRSFGSALRETTTVISVFLLAMSIGYAAGGKIGDRSPRADTLVAVLLFSSVTLLAVPQLDQLFTDRISASANLSLHAFLATALLFAVPTTLLAMISPIAVRLLARDTAHSGRVAGSVSALSTIGSVVGTIVTAFFIIDWIGSINRTVILLGTVIAALALLLMITSALQRGWSDASRFMRWAGPLAATSLVLVGCISFRGPVALHEQLVGGGSRIVFERDSPYHHVRVIDHGGARDLLIDRNVQSRLYLNDPNIRGLDYPEYLHVARLLRPGLRRVLFIGLGGGTHARQFTTFYPDTTADVVEIDPLIVSTARNYFDVRESDRLRIHVGDGRVFLRTTDRRYDLISIDAYTRGKYGSTIPPHLVTREFFQEAARHLTEQGIVHFHDYVGRDSLLTRSLYKTMTAVFSSVIVLGESELMASHSQLAADADDLIARAGSIRKRLPRIDDRIATLRRPLPDPIGATLLTDDYAPVDTLLRQH